MIDNLDGTAMTSELTRKVIRKKIKKTIDRFDRYPLLDVVFDYFLRRLMQRLALIYGVTVDAQLMHKDITRFGNYFDDVPFPALLCIFEAREWHDSGLVVIDGGITEANLEFLLGGDEDSQFEPEARTATHLDRALARQFVNASLEELSDAFFSARNDIGRIAMDCERIESSPQFAAITREQTPVFVARIQLDIGEMGRSGQLDIVMPMPMLEPIRRYLTEAYRGEQKANDIVWTRHITSALMEMPLPIDAELERVALPINRVMDWKVGDVLPLSSDLNTPVELHIRDITGRSTVLTGKLGALKGSKAIRLISDNAAQFGSPLQRLTDRLGIKVDIDSAPDGEGAKPPSLPITNKETDPLDFGSTDS